MRALGVERRARAMGGARSSRDYRRTRQMTVAQCSAAPAPRKGTAVVVGGGLAGMSTAQVLTRHFEKVVLLERDAVDSHVAPQRSGVPQYAQVHNLLLSGLEQLEALFPGYKQQLRGEGANEVDWGGSNCVFFDYGTDFVRAEEGTALRTFAASRALYEAVVRRRVLANPRIALRTGADVAGLDITGGGGGSGGGGRQARRHVTGVVLRGGERVAGDLVVDASGRGSKTPDWLTAAGLPAPRKLVLNANLGYGTRVYELPPDAPWPPPIAATVVGTQPSGTRAGMAWFIEGRRLQVILAGYNGDHPPTDDAGYDAFMASLPQPYVCDLVRGCTPVTPVMSYLGTQNVRRMYEEVELPERLVVLGDAACSFNPLYGQGITVGVTEAGRLGAMVNERLEKAGGDLDAALAGLSNSFQKEVAQVLEMPWSLAVGADARFRGPGTNFDPPQSASMLKGYMSLLALTARHDAAVFAKWGSVFHMVKPPTALFEPDMLLKAGWCGVKKALGMLGSDSPSAAAAAGAAPGGK